MANKKRTKNRTQIVEVPPLDLNRRYDINESLEYLRISRALAYVRIQKGLLRTVKDGGRVFINGAEIQRYLNQPSVAA